MMIFNQTERASGELAHGRYAQVLRAVCAGGGCNHGLHGCGTLLMTESQPTSDLLVRLAYRTKGAEPAFPSRRHFLPSTLTMLIG